MAKKAHKDNRVYFEGQWNRTEEKSGRITYMWVLSKADYGSNRAYGIAKGAIENFSANGIRDDTTGKPPEYTDAFYIELSGFKHKDGTHRSGDNIALFEATARKLKSGKIMRIIPTIAAPAIHPTVPTASETPSTKMADDNIPTTRARGLYTSLSKPEGKRLVNALSWVQADSCSSKKRCYTTTIDNGQTALQIADHLRKRKLLSEKMYGAIEKQVATGNADSITITVNDDPVVENKKKWADKKKKKSEQPELPDLF